MESISRKKFERMVYSNEKAILGIWKIDPTDLISIQAYGNTSIEFKENGELTYTIHGDEKDQIISMKFQINKNILITDQPSSPRKEETKFTLIDGKLILEFHGIKSRYVRAD